MDVPLVSVNGAYRLEISGSKKRFWKFYPMFFAHLFQVKFPLPPGMVAMRQQHLSTVSSSRRVCGSCLPCTRRGSLESQICQTSRVLQSVLCFPFMPMFSVSICCTALLLPSNSRACVLLPWENRRCAAGGRRGCWDGGSDHLRGGRHAGQQRQRAHGRERGVRSGADLDHGFRSHGNPPNPVDRPQFGVRKGRLRQASRKST